MNRVLDRATPVLGAVGTKEATMMFKSRTMVAIQEEGGGPYFDGRRLEFCKDLTFAICWFDRQGTSSQYQYCYWSTIVIWILSSDIVSSTNSIQIVRRQWCRWFDSADVITMNMSIRVQLPGHDSSKNGQLAMFRSSHLRVVFHPGQLSDHDPTPFIFQKLFCDPGKISEL